MHSHLSVYCFVVLILDGCLIYPRATCQCVKLPAFCPVFFWQICCSLNSYYYFDIISCFIFWLVYRYNNWARLGLDQTTGMGFFFFPLFICFQVQAAHGPSKTETHEMSYLHCAFWMHSSINAKLHGNFAIVIKFVEASIVCNVLGQANHWKHSAVLTQCCHGMIPKMAPYDLYQILSKKKLKRCFQKFHDKCFAFVDQIS